MFWFLIPPALTAVFALTVQNWHMAVNAALAFACLTAFGWAQRKHAFLPRTTAYAVQGFLLLSLWVGKALRGYDTLPAWDVLLHFLSGPILVSVGHTLYRRIGGEPKNRWLLRLFALFCAVSGAALWEVYEFALDQLFHTASQNGSLTDTMWDIIAGSVGAVTALFCMKKSS